jgi:hypothetical protein|tara:strand:- start:1175 stop:1549 length:375 start_codon:yes stop_codon:yes gene_type:complete
MNTNQKGCFAEYKFATAAMECGLNVSMPLLDSSRYDCIVEHQGLLSKVQIKNANDRNESQFKKGVHVKMLQSGMFYTKDLVDVFAIYVFDGFFIIPNKEQRAFRFIPGGKYSNFFNNFAPFFNY